MVTIGNNQDLISRFATLYYLKGQAFIKNMKIFLAKTQK